MPRAARADTCASPTRGSNGSNRRIGTQGSLAAVTRAATRFIVRLPGSSQVIPVEGQLVSGSYFATLGVSAARGRLLTPAMHASIGSSRSR